MYDTIDNWTYGQLMCRVASGVPILVKLLSQLTMISIVLKRLLKVRNISECETSEGKTLKKELILFEKKTLIFNKI